MTVVEIIIRHETRGRAHAIELQLLSDASYRIEGFTRGVSTLRCTGLQNLIMARADYYKRIDVAKRIDGINYREVINSRRVASDI